MNKTNSWKANNNNNPQRNMQLLVQSFQQNYTPILQYLPFSEHHKLKSICRGLYYLTITHDIWFNLKIQVVDRKMQDYDDIDFVEQENKVLVSKEQKQIRIHSLKKKNFGGSKIREASNVKQKKLAISAINNEMPFRSTEMGFKRLLKTNNNISSKQKIVSLKESQYLIIDLLQIPKEWSSKDLIINVKDPWSLNIHRASNLCLLIKKWNEYHHKLITSLKQVQKDFTSLIKKCIRIDKQISDYLTRFQKEQYSEIQVLLQGSKSNLLIDQQLNKIGRIFVMNHRQMGAIGEYLEVFISKTHEYCVKMAKGQVESKEFTWILEYINSLEELMQQYQKISTKCPELINILSKSLFQIVDTILQDFHNFQLQINGQLIHIGGISLSSISKKSEFFELLFESMEGCVNNMLRLCEGDNSQNLGINLMAGKFRNMKVISHHLWNVSKYFTKITKQLESKEKKGGQSKQTAIIRSFLSGYDSNRQGLMDWKNPQRVQKEVCQLKLRVNNLKGTIQSE